jgi:hypothetical protein
MMSKTSKTPIKTEDRTRSSKVVEAKGHAPKPSTEMAQAISDEDRQVLREVGAEVLTSLQIEETVAISCPDDEIADLALKYGAQALVDEFAPADAVESTLAPVIVAVRNAVMTGFRFATKGSCKRRDIELNIALKCAGMLVQLLETFDSHRGHGKRRVTVGNVNVESGAQAIVGTVETTSRDDSKAEGSIIEPTKPKPRAV